MKPDIQCVYTRHGVFRMDINQFRNLKCQNRWDCVAFFAEHELDCPRHPTWWERHPVVKK